MKSAGLTEKTKLERRALHRQERRKEAFALL
jgi:hypothetical protein